MKNTRSPRAILVAAAASALLLAGCATPADEPAKPVKPTETAPAEPTVEKLEAPTSADEAISGATAAVKEYMALRGEAFADPARASEVEKVAVGQALDRVNQAVAQAKEKGILFSGEFEFEFLRGAAGTLKTNSGEVEFGSVTVTGCYDMSGMETKMADGSEASVSPVMRYEVSPLVVFDQAEGRWMMYSFEDPTEVVEC